MFNFYINNAVLTTFSQVLCIGFTVISFQFWISKFKIKDWSELFFGFITFCIGVVLILLSIIPVFLDFDKLRFTYFQTFPASLVISYFLFFFQKQKNSKIIKKKKYRKCKKKSRVSKSIILSKIYI